MTRSVRRRCLVCLLALAVLFGALLPALAATAARASGGEAWLEICTAYGVQRVAADVGPAEELPFPSDEVCDWCRLHCASPALAPDVRPAAVFPKHDGLPACTFRSDPVRPVCFWQLASPRAPPARA